MVHLRIYDEFKNTSEQTNKQRLDLLKVALISIPVATVLRLGGCTLNFNSASDNNDYIHHTDYDNKTDYEHKPWYNRMFGIDFKPR